MQRLGIHAADLERFRYSILACSLVGIWSLHVQLWGIISKVKFCGGVTGPFGPEQASL